MLLFWCRTLIETISRSWNQWNQWSWRSKTLNISRFYCFQLSMSKRISKLLIVSTLLELGVVQLEVEQIKNYFSVQNAHLDQRCSIVRCALPGCFGFSGLCGRWLASPGSWQSLCGGGPDHRPQTGTSSGSSRAPSCCTAGSRRVSPAHESGWQATAGCWNSWMSCQRRWNLKPE